MVDFHTFLQDVLETGGLDVGKCHFWENLIYGLARFGRCKSLKNASGEFKIRTYW